MLHEPKEATVRGTFTFPRWEKDRVSTRTIPRRGVQDVVGEGDTGPGGPGKRQDLPFGL